MKTPQWEPSAGNLLAFLNSATQIVMADLYTFTTSDGSVFRYTSSDRLLSVNGRTFAMGPKIARSTTRLTVGVEVDSLNIDMYADSSITMGALPFVQAVSQGLLDNGTLMVERLFMDSGLTQQGSLLMFSGRIGQVVTERGHAGIEVLSHMTLLDVQIPTAVYQPSCRATLFDSLCTLSRPAFAINKPATSTTDATRTIFSANLTGTPAATAGYCSLGVVACTAGANVGVTRTVKSHTGTGTASIQVISPWPAAVAVGDSFTFYPGCDKTKATCQSSKFNNLAHFRGEPFVPLPEMVTA